MQNSLIGSKTIREAKGLRLDISLLTTRMQRGEDEAYRVFYGAYFSRLLGYLLVLTGGAEEAAKEALQLTMVRIVRHVRPFESEEVFWSWLTVLARSAVIDEARKRTRYLGLLDRFFQSENLELRTSGIDSETVLMPFLEKGLAILSSVERDLIERRYFQRQSVREMAEALACSEKAIESRLVRIRKALKEMIIEELKHEQ